jgi:hypothetical protein
MANKKLEDLCGGDIFTHQNNNYVLTMDYKKSHRLSTNLTDGSSRWLENSSDIDLIQLYLLDEDNNITPLKENKSDVVT